MRFSENPSLKYSTHLTIRNLLPLENKQTKNPKMAASDCGIVLRRCLPFCRNFFFTIFCSFVQRECIFDFNEKYFCAMFRHWCIHRQCQEPDLDGSKWKCLRKHSHLLCSPTLRMSGKKLCSSSPNLTTKSSFS